MKLNQNKNLIHQLSQKSFGSLFYFILPVSIWSSKATLNTDFLIGFTLLLSLLVCARIVLSSPWGQSKFKSEKKWIISFIALIWITAALLGFLEPLLLKTFGLYSFPALFGFLFLAFVSAAALTVLSHKFILAVGYLLLMILPQTIFLAFFEPAEGAKIFAMASFLFLGFLAQQARYLSRFFSDYESQKQNLSSLQDQMWSFVDTLPGLVSWFDMNLNYIGVNKKLAAQLGFRRHEMTGKKLGFQGQEEDAFVKLVKNFHSGNQTIDLKEISISQNQKTVHFLSILTKNGESDNFQIGAISLDISAIKNREKELEVQTSRIQENEKLVSLGQMAGGIAHEVNNPLAIIAGKAEALYLKVQKGTIDPDQLLKGLEVIQNTSHRISKIIQSLRKLAQDSRIETVKQYRIAEVINSVLDINQNRIQSEGIEIRSNFHDKNMLVECGLVEIGQVLMNLISNSIHALEKIDSKWIEISTRSYGSTVQVFFSDSGSGIPKELQTKIFSPFFTTKSPGKGTGIGLSLSKKLMQQQGGDIWYDPNRPNTCFVIELKKAADQDKKNPAA